MSDIARPEGAANAQEGLSQEALDVGPLLRDTPALQGKVAIVPGFELAYEVAMSRAHVELSVLAMGLVVWRTMLSADKPVDRISAKQGPFKEDLTFRVDLGEGEIRARGEVCVWDVAKGAYDCKELVDEVLVAFSPTLGEVGGSPIAHAPVVSDREVGDSSSVVPNITRIPVDDVNRLGTPVGKLVKERLFRDKPEFLFNVCFAVGKFLPLLPGTYGDPRSIWFNVFVGYYEIVAPKPAWQRPFGYDLVNGRGRVRFDEVLAIGKADWNYFSNWMYGVPLEHVQRFDQPDAGTRTSDLGRVTVGTKQWDLVDVDGFSAVSAYQSGAKGAAKLVDNTSLTPLWRTTYGEPRSVEGFDESFFGTMMRAKLYMSFREDAASFSTYLFGGTVNKAFDGKGNDHFMDVQLEACRKVMLEYYPGLGFSG